MTLLSEIMTSKTMSYVSHPIADIMYRITTQTDIGAIFRANDKVFWARNSSNPAMEELYEIRAYENVWMEI